MHSVRDSVYCCVQQCNGCALYIKSHYIISKLRKVFRDIDGPGDLGREGEKGIGWNLGLVGRTEGCCPVWWGQGSWERAGETRQHCSVHRGLSFSPMGYRANPGEYRPGLVLGDFLCARPGGTPPTQLRPCRPQPTLSTHAGAGTALRRVTATGTLQIPARPPSS